MAKHPFKIALRNLIRTYPDYTIDAKGLTLIANICKEINKNLISEFRSQKFTSDKEALVFCQSLLKKYLGAQMCRLGASYASQAIFLFETGVIKYNPKNAIEEALAIKKAKERRRKMRSKQKCKIHKRRISNKRRISKVAKRSVKAPPSGKIFIPGMQQIIGSLMTDEMITLSGGNFLADILVKFVKDVLSSMSNDLSTITHIETIDAVREILPSDLKAHAVAEGGRALMRYANDLLPLTLKIEDAGIKRKLRKSTPKRKARISPRKAKLRPKYLKPKSKKRKASGAKSVSLKRKKQKRATVSRRVSSKKCACKLRRKVRKSSKSRRRRPARCPHKKSKPKKKSTKIFKRRSIRRRKVSRKRRSIPRKQKPRKAQAPLLSSIWQTGIRKMTADNFEDVILDSGAVRDLSKVLEHICRLFIDMFSPESTIEIGQVTAAMKNLLPKSIAEHASAQSSRLLALYASKI